MRADTCCWLWPGPVTGPTCPGLVAHSRCRGGQAHGGWAAAAVDTGTMVARVGRGGGLEQHGEVGNWFRGIREDGSSPTGLSMVVLAGGRESASAGLTVGRGSR
jgi:hypothetical protein